MYRTIGDNNPRSAICNWCQLRVIVSIVYECRDQKIYIITLWAFLKNRSKTKQPKVCNRLYNVMLIKIESHFELKTLNLTELPLNKLRIPSFITICFTDDHGGPLCI